MYNRIFIFSKTGPWKVRCDHCWGYEVLYGTRKEAIDAACLHVARLKKGEVAGIMIQLVEKKNTPLRREWVYGRDPYPPQREGESTKKPDWWKMVYGEEE